MDDIASFIILLIFSLPIYGLLIWQYINPEESFLLGRRWMYKDDPEPSEELIKHYKTMSVVGIVIMTLVIIAAFFEL